MKAEIIKNCIVEQFEGRTLDFIVCTENIYDYSELFIEDMCDYCYNNDINLYDSDGNFTSIETKNIFEECMCWLSEKENNMLSLKTILRNEKLNKLLNEN